MTCVNYFTWGIRWFRDRKPPSLAAVPAKSYISMYMQHTYLDYLLGLSGPHAPWRDSTRSSTWTRFRSAEMSHLRCLAALRASTVTSSCRPDPRTSAGGGEWTGGTTWSRVPLRADSGWGINWRGRVRGGQRAFSASSKTTTRPLHEPTAGADVPRQVPHHDGRSSAPTRTRRETRVRVFRPSTQIESGNARRELRTTAVSITRRQKLTPAIV